jgi:citrate synthase
MDIEKIIAGYTEKAIENSKINPELYGKYEVKRGLRDISGKSLYGHEDKGRRKSLP